MKTLNLTNLAARHCASHKPALNLEGFVSEAYGTSRRFLSAVAAGKRKPSQKLLRGIAQAHMRLFPSEPVLLVLPNNHPPIVLGDLAHLNSSN